MQRTLVLAKPDAVQRGLVGEIIGRFERKGLKLVGLRLLAVPRSMAEPLATPAPRVTVTRLSLVRTVATGRCPSPATSPATPSMPSGSAIRLPSI